MTDMANEIRYDDRNLQQLFADMEPKRRLQALKGGFRKEADKIRKTAVDNLRSSGIRSDKDLEKGIRAVVSRREAGFRVTVHTKRAGKKGESGYHTNRRGLKKPVLVWAEMGTDERRTKPRKKAGRYASRKRGAHSTGSMRRYGYMEKTLNGVRNTVTDDLHDLVTENVEKIAKKYGCK